MRREAKLQKELKRRYGKLAETMEEYYHHLDLRSLDDLDDDVFAYIMPKVKGVNMLDLNETGITNESIKQLTKLEYVNELRLKGCTKIDNEAVPFINQLTQLTFLHLNGTGIDIDGLLGLTSLPLMKQLLFPSEALAPDAGKMRQLRKQLPVCEFVVNSKLYEFDDDEEEQWRRAGWI